MQNKQPVDHNLSADFQFLITCCQVEQSHDDTTFLKNHILEKDAQYLTALVSLSVRHGILPLVYKTIKDISEQDNNFVPQEFFSELKAHYMGISQRNMLMSAELIRIMKLLEENGIEALAFKGPALSQMAYGDITLRQYSDLDILIRKKDRVKMMDLLIKEKYIPEIDLEQDIKETFFNCVNVIGLYKDTNRILVEVHWELLSKNYAIDWEEESLWSKKEYIPINNTNIPVLPTEQLLLYLCAHGSKHLFERIEWICDIDRAVKSSPSIDWGFLVNEAEKLGIKRMLYLGLSLSQQFFNLQLPENIKKDILEDKEVPKLISKVIEVNFTITSQQGKNYSSFGLLWSMRENLSDQLRFAWRGLFAPKFDDFKFIKLPKHLTFLYPFIRPYRLIRKYAKRDHKL